MAISVSGLGKCYRLGETHEVTLSSRLASLPRRMLGRVKRAPSETEIFWALRDVSFNLEQGGTLGIVGGNGAGKSTLLKILSRITPPTLGTARVRGRLASLLEVGTGFHPELTGRANVFLNGTILGMRHAEVAKKFDDIVAFAGVERFIDTPVKRYSSGMYVRLAFAVAAHLEPDVLIVDEVLAVGDAEFQRRCLGKMSEVAEQGRTVLFVSHNMAAVRKLCRRVLWLRNGSIEADGEPEAVIAAYMDSSTQAPENKTDLAPGVLYRKLPDVADSADADVIEVALIDPQSSLPLTRLRTWDAVAFRIRFRTRRDFRIFSVVLSLATTEGVKVIFSSTTPDHAIEFGCQPGDFEIRCVFDRLPLAAGDYVLGLGLAIPMVEFVWREDSLCMLQVGTRDVYHSGVPPTISRYVIASDHAWTTPCPVT